MSADVVEHIVKRCELLEIVHVYIDRELFAYKRKESDAGHRIPFCNGVDACAVNFIRRKVGEDSVKTVFRVFRRS